MDRSKQTTDEIRNDARNAAEAVLEAYWASRSIPIDPVKIARSMGLSVFEAQLGEDTWGMIIADEGGTANIYLDEDQAPTRARFSCAHELGHYVDHQCDLEPSTGYEDKRSTAGIGEPSEVYANEFAGALLSPEAELRDLVGQGLDTFEIASAFLVSPASIDYRRKLLGI